MHLDPGRLHASSDTAAGSPTFQRGPVQLVEGAASSAITVQHAPKDVMSTQTLNGLGEGTMVVQSIVQKGEATNIQKGDFVVRIGK
jgi:hypothetical protein